MATAPTNGQVYNSGASTPYDNTNYFLTPEFWEKSTMREAFDDFAFLDLMSPEGGGGAIIFKTASLDKGGKQVTVSLRLNPDKNTKPVKGDNQLVNYGTLGDSLTEDMTWGKLQVYAGRERYGWMKYGDESERMIEYLDVAAEASVFLGELIKQRNEEAVIHTWLFGLSQSVTRVPDKGGSASGHLRKMPPSFKRNWSASYGISQMPHPNTFFIDEAEITTLQTAITANSADILLEAVLNAMIADQTGTEGYLTASAMIRAQRLARKLKIKKLMTPYGMRWVWFVPGAVATTIRSIMLTYNASTGPRDYAANRMYSGVLGDFMGFLFVESEYLLPFITHITNDSLATTALGYDNVDTVGTMALAAFADSALKIYPTLIIGQEAMAYSRPRGLKTPQEDKDLGNVMIKGADHTYGFRRADIFNDNTTDYFSGGTSARSLTSTASTAGTPVVRNWSSMLVFCKADEAVA